MKADRLPGWALRRLSAEKREAFDRLRWHNPGTAERARLKGVLGWKRTRAETVALALELLDEGLIEVVVANRLGVSRRYLRKLLADESVTPENTPLNPTVQAAKVRPTCEVKVGLPPTESDRESGRSPRRFVGLEDLDRWLDQQA